MPRGVYERIKNPITNIPTRPVRPPAERFWEKVSRSDGCWLWTGAHDGRGYGKIQLGTLAEPRLVNAARFSYELANGPIEGRRHVLHRCDVRDCVRPSHLFLGTNADNMADKAAKGRAPRGEKIPSSKLTELQVKEIRTLAARGILNESAMARELGVSVATVSNVIHRRTWRHLP